MLIPACISCGKIAGWGGTYVFEGQRDWEIRPGMAAVALVDEDEDEDEDGGRWEEIVCLGCEDAVTPEQYRDVLKLLLSSTPS